MTQTTGVLQSMLINSTANGGSEMIKEMLLTINHAMLNGEMSVFCAKKLLESLSLLTGKKYYILKKRVVYKEEDHVFDAWANA